MINATIDNSPVRSVKGKVELYDGSTLLDTYTYRDKLKSFTIERVGEEGKFFGFGICQKINIHLIDMDRELDITTAHSFKAFLTTGEDYINPFPIFYVSEVHRDENTNELSITAYDALYTANNITFFMETVEGEEDTTVYTPKLYAEIISIELGLSMKSINIGGIEAPIVPLQILNVPEDDTSFETEYVGNLNLSGTETLRQILNAIAEATQTIYYLDNEEYLIFKRLDMNGEAALTISKADYFTLESKTNRRLAAIAHITELGDNDEATLEITGTTQYVRNNPFWDLRGDISPLLNNALAAIGGITINQFDCSWRGNYLLEPGDKINLITRDDEVVSSYLLNDTIEYNGFLAQATSWNYGDDNEQIAANPTSLGDAIKQTYARVDKANQTIQLMIESVNEFSESTGEAIDSLTEQVSLTMTTEAIEAKFSQIQTEGVEQITTSEKKFTLNDEGLNISDSNSAMSTHIDEDGMTISREGQEVLIANNEGVKAEDLHATTYLIIGTNSRFEDYGSRTGCFWIGG